MILVFCDAGIAQLVEHNLAMVRVASSNLVSRSRKKAGHLRVTFFCPKFIKTLFLFEDRYSS